MTDFKLNEKQAEIEYKQEQIKKLQANIDGKEAALLQSQAQMGDYETLKKKVVILEEEKLEMMRKFDQFGEHLNS